MPAKKKLKEMSYSSSYQDGRLTYSLDSEGNYFSNQSYPLGREGLFGETSTTAKLDKPLTNEVFAEFEEIIKEMPRVDERIADWKSESFTFSGFNNSGVAENVLRVYSGALNEKLLKIFETKILPNLKNSKTSES